MTPLPPDRLPGYTGTRVAVTGGASFIGSHLVEALLEHGAHVKIADDFSSGTRTNLRTVSGHVEVLEGDVRDPDVARRAVSGTDIVFHLAAAHGGRGYIETHPVECTNNMLLDHVVFGAAAAAGAGRIVHASSACVYPLNLQDSDTRRLLLAEDDANFDEPGKAFADGEYGWAKLMGELQLRAFHKQYGTDTVAARIFTAYGERENESHAVLALIGKAVARLDPYPVWGDGRQTRNFTYVRDTVHGLALAGLTGLTGPAGLNGNPGDTGNAESPAGSAVLNIGSGEHHTVLDLLEVIFEHLGWRPAELDFQLDRPVGVRSRASDNTHIRELTGWEPATSLHEGVSATIDWYVENTPPERLSRLADFLMTR